jgi:hypothetical protein
MAMVMRGRTSIRRTSLELGRVLINANRSPLSGANRKTFAHFETYRFGPVADSPDRQLMHCERPSGFAARRTETTFVTGPQFQREWSSVRRVPLR